MDYRIFIVHTDVNASDCTRGCTDTERESALNGDSGKKIPCRTGSPWAHFHVVGTLRFMSDINQLSLPTPFYSVLVSISVFKALSTVFHSINSPDSSPFSDCVLPVFSLP